MDKQPDSKFTLGSNCTGSECSSIPNADCLASFCKCRIGFGPSTDRRACRKSKKIGQPCTPNFDTCYMDKLHCDEISNVCQCAPGYKYDSLKNDCEWMYYCEQNLIYDTVRRQCIKPSDFWFPTANHNPKLSFITFILLVFCFIKVMRNSNSSNPYNERRRRVSTNLNRNSFDLLSTIINYETNQRYPVRGDRPPDRQSTRGLRRAGDHEESAEFYDENLPPPAYEDIIRNDDLKTVTVEPSPGDIELKELNQETRRKLSNVNGPEESSCNHSNHAYASHNHIASSESSSETSLEETDPTVSSRGQLPNGPVTFSSDSSTSQPSDGSSHSHHPNDPMNRSQSEQHPPPDQPNQSNDQPNQSNDQLNQSNEQLPTYEQAVQSNRRN